MRIDKVRLQAELIKRGMTMEQLSEKSGVSLSAIKRAKTGKNCRFSTVFKIAECFGMDVEELGHFTF